MGEVARLMGTSPSNALEVAGQAREGAVAGLAVLLDVFREKDCPGNLKRTSFEPRSRCGFLQPHAWRVLQSRFLGGWASGGLPARVSCIRASSELGFVSQSS